MSKDESQLSYICIHCSFLYNPAEGDAMNDIPPGTAFKDLPDTWVCPLCYAAKTEFDPLG